MGCRCNYVGIASAIRQIAADWLQRASRQSRATSRPHASHDRSPSRLATGRRLSDNRPMEAPRYLHLKPGVAPPRLEGVAPFKAVVVVDSEVTPEWQAQVSDWLVRSGCRWMMAWGRKCGDWDTSVDLANLAMFDYGEIPDDDFVVTTWHENESLQETFWFSEQCAMHP